MTSLTAIKAEVSARVKTALIPALIGKMRYWHAARGWRMGCECRYCRAKLGLVLDMGEDIRGSAKRQILEIRRERLNSLFDE
jgi:hypothetical protein